MKGIVKTMSLSDVTKVRLDSHIAGKIKNVHVRDAFQIQKENSY